MLAHVSPSLILAVLGSVAMGNLAAVIATVGAFTSRRHRPWLSVTAWLAIVLGTGALGLLLHIGGAGDWVLLLSLTPIILGAVSLQRIGHFTA